MTHLTLDERLALIEAADEPRHLHLAECARCRADVESGRAALAATMGVDVPEPSPLFWDAFSRRVADRLGVEPVQRVPAGWRFWRVLLLLAAAVGGLVLAVGIDRSGPTPLPAAASAVLAVSGESSVPIAASLANEWDVLASLAGEFDLDTLTDSLGRTGESADRAVWTLTERERVEMAALVQAELRQ